MVGPLANCANGVPKMGVRVARLSKASTAGIAGWQSAIAACLSEAAGEGTKMADHLSPIVRPAFPSSAIISERSSPSRVRFAAPNNGAPLTGSGPFRTTLLRRGKG